MDDEIIFTVFTPTYNRADKINRVYESLKKQTLTSFEWLIIDDGSTDNTSSIIQKWIDEGYVKIRYYFQENKHKFYTILKAAKLSKGELFYIIDSDDRIFPNTLEILHKTWISIPDDKRKQFIGVTGLSIDQYGKLVGDKFPDDIFDSDSIRSNYKYKIKGEKTGFQRTDVMKNLKFSDEYFNNGLIPEGIIWMEIALRGYKTRYINEKLRVYYIESGSLMTSGQFKTNSFGIYQSEKMLLNKTSQFFFYNIKRYLIGFRNYSASAFFQKITPIQQIINLESIVFKILFIPFIFFGYLFYLKNKY